MHLSRNIFINIVHPRSGINIQCIVNNHHRVSTRTYSMMVVDNTLDDVVILLLMLSPS